MSPWVPPPDVGVEDLRSLTLILSTQRSGSTLLGHDIQSLGGLGRPREHFAGVNNGKRDAPVSEADVLEVLMRGLDKIAPGVTGFKLQVSQAAAVAHGLTGRRQETPQQAMSTVVSWAQDKFDRVLIVVLVRNAVDIAISRVFANQTGTYNSRRPGALLAGAPLPPIPDINERILFRFERALTETRVLNMVAAEHSDDVLFLTYDELTGQVEETTHRLVARAREVGLEPREETTTRNMEKVISIEESARVRESFLDYLRTWTGVAPG